LIIIQKPDSFSAFRFPVYCSCNQPILSASRLTLRHFQFLCSTKNPKNDEHIAEYLPIAIGFAQREAILIPHMITCNQMSSTTKASSVCSNSRTSLKNDVDVLQRSPTSNKFRMPLSLREYNEFIVSNKNMNNNNNK
jgi:hypothetical protein